MKTDRETASNNNGAEKPTHGFSQTTFESPDGERSMKTATSRSSMMKKTLSLTLAIFLAMGPLMPEVALALPHGGKITSGSGSIKTVGNTTTIQQNSNALSINWNSFNISANQAVNYLQPSFSSLALNFISGTSASQIFGHLSANGQVFLMNPFGIVFGQSAQVNVGGLLAAGMNLQKYAFGTQLILSGTGTVSNAGHITALPGGTVALVGRNVSNTGTVTAPSGTVALGAGSQVTLDFSGTDLVDLVVNSNTVQATIDNGGLLAANGGQILLKAGAQNSLAASVVNNTGIVEAQTLGMKDGKIVLLSGMENGTTNVAGTLDASAPNGGNGGSIETSGNRVNVANGAVVTTEAPDGLTGTWTLDPTSFYIGTNNATTLGYDLTSSNVIINSSGPNTPSTIPPAGGGTLGNIYVNTAVNWSSGNSLTLNAVNNVDVNAPIMNGGTGNIVLRADDMDIGGVASIAPPGVPSGVGTVNINTGGSVGTAGNLSIYTNPTNYGNALVNPGTHSAYVNANSSGTLTAYDLLSSNADLYYIDQNQTSQVLSNNYALNTNITLPTVTLPFLSTADAAQVSSSTTTNGETYSSGSSTNSNWVRFGGSSAPFTGSFDGLSHTIS
ncbi:MAG: two-partner secretion domain-containing protein, partial [Leptospirales bacterium]